MAHARLRIAVALVALAGCTVAIPDAAHFPEARDVQVTDSALDTADVADAAVDAADSHDAGGTDASDAAADAPDTADADLADAATPDAAADVADAADAPDTADIPDTADVDAATDAVDVGPSCTPSQCDDANPCTTDDCGSDGGCIHTVLDAIACPDDGLPCTGDSCQAGTCVHTTLLPGWCIVSGDCHTAGELTADGCAICQPATTPVAWTPLPDATTCSDGTVCTVGDHCQTGVCLPGTATTCDDGNPCTADVCDAVTGCSNANLDDGAGCPATGMCQLPGGCFSGVCTSTPKLWSTSMDGGTGGADRFSAVALTAQGEIIAVGARAAASGWQQGWAVHLDAASDLVENLPALADPAGDAHYGGVAVAADGAIAIGGATTTDAVLQLVAANGAPQKVLPFSAFGAGEVTQVAAVAGGGWLLLDAQGHAARITATGAPVWTAQATAFGAHVLAAIAGTSDGGAIAVGYLANPDVTSASAVAVRFSSTGAIVWQRGFGDAGTGYLGVRVAADGTCIVAGTSNGLKPAIVFDHLSAAGTWLGTNVAAGPSPANVRGAFAAADGTWRLVGDTGNGGAWLGAFDALGNSLWQQTYDAGIARGVALLPGGGAVVVGETGAPSDGLVVRTDSWGTASCADSQLCANLVSSACDDGLPCTVDSCIANVCGHAALTLNGGSVGPCDDGDPCVVAENCTSGQCAGTASLQSSVDPSLSGFIRVAALPDGGAIVTGTANFVANLDAGGSSRWSNFVAGSPVLDVAGLANGWAVTLQAGSLQRFWPNGGSLVLPAIAIDGGAATALTVLRDDSVVVVGTAGTGTPGQTAFVERFDASWTGTPVTLPGSFGLSQGLAIAASAKGGCGVLTVEGNVAKIHRLDADLLESWATPLSYPGHVAIAAMPDDGWLVAGPGAKGLALERYGPDGVFEFAQQWPIPGLTDVRALAVLPDGTSAVAIERLAGAFSQGGVARFGPLGDLLSVAWGPDGSQALDLTAVERPDGIWLVGSAPGGGWLQRTDSHGGTSCAASGTCISQSLVCDDGNPCTTDGCAQGQCTATLPTDANQCLDGGVCTAAGACSLLGTCGDGKCNIAESNATCAADCPASCDGLICDDGDPCTIDYCQDGACTIGGAPDGTACAAGKACSFGQCALPGCGDGVCESGETTTNCLSDCPLCGDGVCGPGENNHLCPADCAKPASGCQNMCGWKSTKPGGGVCWCDPSCTPGALGDCCADKATFCP